ncbi:methyl-accepting chemotaxis protein [bacterium]|nr:methyl-accepting chemotaxis protein [bacterium]
MIKIPSITSVKFLFGSIYTIAIIVIFSLIALILPAQIDSTLSSFFNESLVPSIRQDGSVLSEKTNVLLESKKSESSIFSEAAFTREKNAITEGYANLIMPIVDSYDMDLLNVTTQKMLTDIDALKGIKLVTEKNGSATELGETTQGSDLIKSYTKTLESDFSYVSLTLFFDTSSLLEQIENENISFKQSLKNIDESVASIVSNVEKEAAIAKKKILSDTTRNIVIAAVIASILFTIISIVLLHLTIIKRLMSANKILHSVAQGDMTRDIVVGRKDEIGRLFVSMKKMQETISDNIRLTNDSSTQLFESSKELLIMSEESNKGINNQEVQTERAASLIEKLAFTVNGVSDKTASAVSAAQESLKKSTVGKESVQNIVLAINELSGNIKESERMIHGLAEESKAISSILDVITGISEQTNLLALNAAIEAARAGETGRGFAVVADEVRTLASRTQTSANDIREMVERLSLQTGSAVKGMEKSRSNADNAVEKAQQAGEAIHSLSSSICVMSDINADITSTASEQSMVSKEIHKNISDINVIGNNNSTIGNDMSSRVEGLSEIAKELKGIVSYFTLSESASKRRVK